MYLLPLQGPAFATSLFANYAGYKNSLNSTVIFLQNQTIYEPTKNFYFGRLVGEFSLWTSFVD